jgi:hypothetical protein
MLKYPCSILNIFTYLYLLIICKNTKQILKNCKNIINWNLLYMFGKPAPDVLGFNIASNAIAWNEP